MAKGDGLRHLQMGETGHDGASLSGGFFSQRQHHILHLNTKLIHSGADVKPEIECDLIVTAACRVQPPSGVTDQFLKAAFDVEVNVFQLL